jgi:kumamolisin
MLVINQSRSEWRVSLLRRCSTLGALFIIGFPVRGAVPPPVTFDESIRQIPAAIQSAASNAPTPFVSRTTLTAGELGTTMDFEVALKMRNFSELQSRLARGERIPATEMSAKYSPLGADYKAVTTWLRRSGFEITREDSNHLAVFARGKVSLIRDVLQVTFARVTLEGAEYTSAVSAPKVPADVAPVLLGVNGLQPHLRMHKHLVARPSSLTGTNAPYLPSQIAQAYKANGLYTSSVTGSGESIAISIDTFPDASDLTSFWQTYGVSQSISNITFIQVVAGTLPAPEGEETLDTEWSSSIAPGAKVRVYAAQSLAFTALDQTYQQIYSDATIHPEYGIHQMSMSYGIGETYTTRSQVQTDDQYFAELAAAGVTVFASSGDGGSTPGPGKAGDESGPVQTASPADDPNVTSVGGTSLTLGTKGDESSETVWNDSYGAGGGGSSIYFNRPYWQMGTGMPAGTTRQVPDVSSSADPVNGAVVIFGGSQVIYGGTSWSSPTWAGFCALINQNRAKVGRPSVGLLGPYLYPQLGTANFRDITIGSNITAGSGGLYSAAAGYDLASGLGVPNVQTLAQTLQTFIPTPPQAPVFTSAAPPTNVAVNSSFSLMLTASGYPAPAFSTISGSLPPGLTLTSAGLLSGTLTQAGTFTSTIAATNGVSPSASLIFSISVYNSPAAPTITDGPPPANATVTFPYNFDYTASGYPAPAFAVKSGALPGGLALSSTGVLSGTPSQAGSFSGVVSATNGVSPAATQSFAIKVIQPAAPQITNGPPPATVALGVSYKFTYASSGQPAPTFAVTSGTLPPGITLSSGGTLSGTPTQTGAYSGTVTCSDGYGTAATQNFNIAVRQVPRITNPPVSVPIALNAPYSFAYTAVGYPTPTFAITAGSLPPGMTLSPTGVLSGAATQVGTYTATATASNSAGSAHQSITISVKASMTFALTLPGTVNEGDPDGQGTVTSDAASSSSVTVQLVSSNPAAFTVPASVTIPIGQVSVTFPYTIIDNLNVFGTHSSTVTASASGWASAKEIVTVTDNKTTDNWSSFGNGQAHTGLYRGSLLGGTYTPLFTATFPSTTAALNPVTIAKGIAYVTPITDFGNSDLTAVNATTGAQIWQYVYSAPGQSPPGNTYYSINPPTIYKGNVYVQQGQGRASGGSGSVPPKLWSFNAATAQVNWLAGFSAQWERYLAPTIYQSVGIWVDGGTSGGLYEFNFDGSERSFIMEPQCDQWTPTYYNGTIYTWVSTYGGTTGIFKAVNPASGAILWSVTAPSALSTYDMNCAAPIDSNLAFLNGIKSLTAINVSTHSKVWTIKGTFAGTPAVGNGKLYVLSGSKVEVLNETTGAILNSMDTGDSGLTGQPVVATDSLVVSSSNKSYLYNLQTFALVQTIPYGGSVSVAGGNLYLAGSEGTLRVYHSSNDNFDFAKNGGVGLTSYGFTATGQTLSASLSFVPKAGTVLTVIDNTGPDPISGTFSNLPNGGTIILSYEGINYIFTANYSGGDGNNLTLTYSSTPPQAPEITDGPPPATAYTTGSYNFTYTDVGSPAATFSLLSGGLPPGLTLSASGVLSGIPARTGSYSGTVSGQNGNSPNATQNFAITVRKPVTPVITNSPPTALTYNAPFSFKYSVQGSPTPTFAVTSGTLPPGLSLSSGGLISGTPTLLGTYSFTVTANNGFSPEAVQNVSLLIEQPPSITSAPVDVPVLINSSYQFTVTGSGYPPPTFSVVSGSLPPGMTLTSSGLLSGSPTQLGTFTGTITATSGTLSVSQAFTITIQASPTLVLDLPDTLSEDDPDGEGTLLSNAPPENNLTVQLASSNTGALTVPTSVVIPAGARSVAVPYTVIDNLAVYGNQTSTVSATASYWVGGNQVVTVTDNKTSDNWSSYGNGQAHTGFYRGSLLGGTYSLLFSTTFPSKTAALNPVTVQKGIAYVTPISRLGISDLNAVDALTGEQIWRYIYSNGNDGSGNTYNSINPPTVYKGNVYVQQGQGLTGGGSTLVSPELWSFDAASGQVNWSARFGAQWESYLAPTVYQSIGIWVDGGAYGGLYGFNFDGSERSFTSEPQCDQWTPTYYSGTIYTWVTTAGAGTGTFSAVNPASGTVLWSAEESATNDTYDMNCAVPIVNDMAFLNCSQSVTALNVTSHAVAWTAAGTFTGTPAVNNGRVYVISGSEVTILDATSGVSLGILQADTTLAGQPVVANDSLIVSSATETYLFSLQTGALVQTIPCGGPVSVAGGTLYLAGSNGTLKAYQSNAPTLSFASPGTVGVTSYGYTATGRTLNLALNFAPAHGTVLTAVSNTSQDQISGTFANLPNGGTITASFNGTAYTFIANYAGGDGNDLTLTYP